MPLLAKRILVAAAALFALACLGLLLLNLYVQSALTTSRLEHKLSSALHLPVRLSGAVFTPWSGLKISGITVPRADPGFPGNFLDAAAFRARFEFLPLLRRELVINDVTIEDPHVSWVQNGEGKWRVPRIAVPESEKTGESAIEPIPPPEPPQPKAEKRQMEKAEGVAPLRISVQRFKIRRGKFDFLDREGRLVASFAEVEVDAPRANAEHVEGHATIARITLQNGLTFENVKSPFRFDRGQLQLPGLVADIAQGVLTADLMVETRQPETPFRVDTRFENVGISPLVAGLGGMPGQASGQLGGSLQLAGQAGDSDSIKGKGRVTLAHGIVRQYEFLQMLGQILQIEELTQLSLQKAEAEYRVADGKIWVEALDLQSPNLKLNAAGKIRFKGKLDLQARLTISQRLSRQLPAPIEANFTPVANSDERFLDFDITGNYDRPKTNLQEKIIGKLYEGQALNLLKNLLGVGGTPKKDGRKEEKKKKKVELAPAQPAASPILPEVHLPPVPGASPIIEEVPTEE